MPQDDKQGNSEPKQDVWRVFTAGLMTAIQLVMQSCPNKSEDCDEEESQQGQDIKARPFWKVLLSRMLIVGGIIFGIWVLNGAPRWRYMYTAEVRTLNNSRSIRLQIERFVDDLHHDNSYGNQIHSPGYMYPSASNIVGGTSSSDLLVSHGYLGNYPINEVKRNGKSGPLWAGGEDFTASPEYNLFTMGLASPKQFNATLSPSLHGGSTWYRMVNVYHDYEEVLEKFRRKQSQGRIPEEVQHPFAGNFLYMPTTDRKGAYLVVFGYSDNPGCDFLKPGPEIGQDGKPDGAVHLFLLGEVDELSFDHLGGEKCRQPVWEMAGVMY